MSTNSRIGIENADKSVTSIYCHFDGYWDHHGPILLKCYDTPEKVLELMALGDLSVLDREIGEKQDFNNRRHGWCLFYGRDRGEKGTQAVVHDTIHDFLTYGEEYNYLFRDGEWWTDTKNGFVKLYTIIEHLNKNL